MGFVSDTVSVTTSAIQVAGDRFPGGAAVRRQELMIRPTSGKVTVGTTKAITANAGYTLDSGQMESATIPLVSGDSVWLIAESGIVTVERLITGDVA